MKYKSLLIMNGDQLNNCYGPYEIGQIRKLTNLVYPPLTASQVAENPACLEEVEIIFSGWGMCLVDEVFLNKAPALKAIFYGAGSVQGFASPILFDKGIVLTSSWQANAVPVAEFTFAQIILNLNKTYHFRNFLQESRDWKCRDNIPWDVPGCYGSTVGLVSLGMIGSMVLKFLKTLDVKIRVYDINLTSEKAAEMGVEFSSLKEIFLFCDVISLHTALLPATRGMITGNLMRSMKKGATLINTARGGLIMEEEMINILEDRADLSAVLDVVSPEPPLRDSPLYNLPNIFLTPHIAGSNRMECRRMGQMAIDEFRRWQNGKRLQHQVTLEMLETMA